jgi:hypothetical protein
MSELKRRLTRRELLKITFFGVTAILSGCDERRVTSKRPTIAVKRTTPKVRTEGVKKPIGRRSKGKQAQTAPQRRMTERAKRRVKPKRD